MYVISQDSYVVFLSEKLIALVEKMMELLVMQKKKINMVMMTYIEKTGCLL